MYLTAYSDYLISDWYYCPYYFQSCNEFTQKQNKNPVNYNVVHDTFNTNNNRKKIMSPTKL